MILLELDMKINIAIIRYYFRINIKINIIKRKQTNTLYIIDSVSAKNI
jgi:hypothetical protein